MRRSDSGGVPACYVRTYVRTYFFPDLRPAKAISQAGYAAKGTSQDTYVRTYVESSSLEVTHHVLGRCLLGSPFYWSARRRRATTTTTTTGGGLVSDLRTVACVRTWRMFLRPYVRTHTLRGSVHACERYVQLNDSCTYVRSWWPLPFWPNAISADFNSRYVRTYVRTLFSAHNSRIITQLLFMDRDGGRDGDEVVMGRDGGHVRPRRGGRAWVETAVREAEEAQQAPMARILIQLVTQDLYSCLAVWLFGQRADLIGVGSRLRHVKNCCRLVTVAFISATLCRRTLPAESRARRDWRGLPRYRLEESFVACGSLIIFPRGDEGKSGIELVEYVQEDRSGGQLAAVIRRYGVPLHGATAVT